MMRLAWLTDLHLNFLEPPALARFVDQVASLSIDGVLLTGDISEAPDLRRYLQLLAAAWQIPIYFVLGNHDFYFGSIATVRQQVHELCAADPRLIWLTDRNAIPLSARTALLGHDGWADARLGDYERSYVQMNDHRLIAELSGHDKRSRWTILKQLGDEAAHSLVERLPPALEQFDQVHILTHVPPFHESCWYDGRLSDDQWLPHFICQAMGDVLLAAAARFPHRRLTVLCGHTHGRGAFRPRDNLLVFTGGAEYGRPEVQHLWEIA
jgi:predicted MPP superfamily phosphohydrolase